MPQTRYDERMDTRLMELLVCPLCKGPLQHDRERHELQCPADRLAYPIRDGIAVMLETEARPLEPLAPPPAGHDLA
jgi:uncharacterized protein YbaR (Trm112 family)